LFGLDLPAEELSQKKRRLKNSFFIYGNHFEEIQNWIQFLANPDPEQSLTKTKKELRQSPTGRLSKLV
jgi:hypothetical protein